MEQGYPGHQMGSYPNQQQMWANFYGSGGGPPGSGGGGEAHQRTAPHAPHGRRTWSRGWPLKSKLTANSRRNHWVRLMGVVRLIKVVLIRVRADLITKLLSKAISSWENSMRLSLNILGSKVGRRMRYTLISSLKIRTLTKHLAKYRLRKRRNRGTPPFPRPATSRGTSWSNLFRSRKSHSAIWSSGSKVRTLPLRLFTGSIPRPWRESLTF